jgi:hypothetical protein
MVSSDYQNHIVNPQIPCQVILSLDIAEFGFHWLSREVKAWVKNVASGKLWRLESSRLCKVSVKANACNICNPFHLLYTPKLWDS